jgi:hypothetical protein
MHSTPAPQAGGGGLNVRKTSQRLSGNAGLA